MASTLVALQTVTVGAGGAANIQFTSIPATYTDLQLVLSLRSNRAQTTDNINFKFNSSTFGYSGRYLGGSGSAASSSSNSGFAYFDGSIFINGNTSTSNTFSNISLYIPNYTSSNNKSISADSIEEDNTTTAYSRIAAGLWANSEIINSILIYSDNAANFVQYSTATLYGVYNSALETTPEAPTIGTATAASTGANVAFTPSGTGAPATSYIATSSPGNISATGASSPILVTGLTSGTAYTFTVKGQNPGGTGAASAASNSVTPYDGYESIQTVSLGSATSTITFSSIPSTFKHLQIRWTANQATSATMLNIRVNSDTSSTTYAIHSLTGNGASVGSNNAAPVQYIRQLRSGGISATANIFSVGIIDILDYTDTNKYKTFRMLGGTDLNGSGTADLESGLWMNTAAITQLELFATNNFNQYTTFELYGIR